MNPLRSVYAGAAFCLLLHGRASPSARAHDVAPLPLHVIAGPNESDLIVATNFGLLTSPLQGGSLSCESAAISDAERYSIRFGPSTQALAVGTRGIASSRDQGCSWTQIGVDGLPIVDAWSGAAGVLIVTGSAPTPRHPELAALWLTPDPERAAPHLLHRSFVIELLSATSDASMTAIYAGGSRAGTHAPALLRSLDGGATWQELSPKTSLEVGVLTPMHVSARETRTLLVRASGATEDQLYRSSDGGETLLPVDEVRGRVKRILSIGDDQLAILTQQMDHQQLYLGPTSGPFAAVPLSLRFRDLAARAATLIGLIERMDSEIDLAISRDRGATWQDYRAAGHDAQLATCHRQVPDCVARCRLMASFSMVDAKGCGDPVPDEDAGDAAAAAPELPSGLDGGIDAGAPRRSADGGCTLAAPGSEASALLWLAWLCVLRRRRQG